MVSVNPLLTPELSMKLDTLPERSGVYVMRSADGSVIYVGKAIVLRNRVRSYFHASARQDGKTRRLVGEAVMTAADVLQCADFADSIGVNGWPLEQHVAGDVVWGWPPIPQSRGYNQLPYRMILPRRRTAGGADNLLVAGRCASMTHDGQSAARVSGACFVMGQAAGTAAAMAVRSNASPHDIDVKRLQGLLREQGAFLGANE